MNEPKIFYACAQTDSPNDICNKLGIETIREPGQPVRWHYQDKTVYRPDMVNNFEDKILEYFNIKIIYQDKNQLTLL